MVVCITQNVTEHFTIPSAVCINKCDINKMQSKSIQNFCQKNDIPIVGLIPYDTVFTKAIIEGKSVMEFSNDSVSELINTMWKKVKRLLYNGEKKD